MSGFVYFIQPSGGGHIKVGQSARPDVRYRGLKGLFPYGIDVLATIDGDRTTEGFIHCCFRPIATSQEWFRSEPAVWRFILDIADHGRPSYLPVRDVRQGREELQALAAREFGSEAQAMAAMGYSAAYVHRDAFSDTAAGGGGVRSRLAFAIALKRGLLPDYIAALHVPLSAPTLTREEAA